MEDSAPGMQESAELFSTRWHRCTNCQVWLSTSSNNSTFIFSALKQKRKTKKTASKEAVWPLLKPLSIKLNVCVCVCANTDSLLLYVSFPIQSKHRSFRCKCHCTALHCTEKEVTAVHCSGRKLLVSGALLWPAVTTADDAAVAVSLTPTHLRCSAEKKENVAASGANSRINRLILF